MVCSCTRFASTLLSSWVVSFSIPSRRCMHSLILSSSSLCTCDEISRALSRSCKRSSTSESKCAPSAEFHSDANSTHTLCRSSARSLARPATS